MSTEEYLAAIDSGVWANRGVTFWYYAAKHFAGMYQREKTIRAEVEQKILKPEKDKAFAEWLAWMKSEGADPSYETKYSFLHGFSAAWEVMHPDVTKDEKGENHV
jgi:hypothetical protein